MPIPVSICKTVPEYNPFLWHIPRLDIGAYLDMASDSRPQNIAQLRESGYKTLSVKQEIRKNLINRIRRNEVLFPGIVGFDESVIPQLENAILAGQDIILLGERGQAKSRLIRSMVDLLDEEIPAIDGCELNCDPFSPICGERKNAVTEKGDDAPIRWVPREERYAEKLATPDITVAGPHRRD